VLVYICREEETLQMMKRKQTVMHGVCVCLFGFMDLLRIYTQNIQKSSRVLYINYNIKPGYRPVAVTVVVLVASPVAVAYSAPVATTTTTLFYDKTERIKNLLINQNKYLFHLICF
jgi:hypothetical protein